MVSPSPPENLSLLSRRRSLATTLGLVSLLAACNKLDFLASQFDKVAVGDSRASAISAMGEPDSSSSLEIPLLRVDFLAWKSHSSGKVYLMLCALNKIVAKTALQ